MKRINRNHDYLLNIERSPDQCTPFSLVPTEHRLAPETARAYYLYARDRIYIPKNKRWDGAIPLGAHALLTVIALRPSEYGEDGRRILEPTEQLADRLDQGLIDISEAGIYPIRPDVEDHYRSFRDALVRESQKLHLKQIFPQLSKNEA